MEDGKIEVVVSGYDNLKAQFGEVYTRDQLTEKYIIESEAYGGVLCTSKSHGMMTLFQPVNCDNIQYLCKIGF